MRAFEESRLPNEVEIFSVGAASCCELIAAGSRSPKKIDFTPNFSRVKHRQRILN
jgi:hypothetical protein